MVTYTVDYTLWKLNIKGYHLTNILLHILAAITIYHLMNVIYRDRFLSLLTGIFFVTHPVHTEAVSYISGRSDSLGALFLLFSFIAYIKILQNRNAFFYILMILSYIGALLSREANLVLPLLLLAYHGVFRKKIMYRNWGTLTAIAILYALLRSVVLKDTLPAGYIPFVALSQRFIGFLAAIANYTRLLVFPCNLHMEYGMKLFRLTEPMALAGIVITILLLSYAYKKRNNKIISFSILWFFAALMPVSNLYALNAYMAEHWLYIPSIGFFVILGNVSCFIYRKEKIRIIGLFFIIGLIIFYSSSTIMQNNYWKDPVTFYERTLKYAPLSYKIMVNLGYEYISNSRNKDAAVLFKRVLQINPNYMEAYNGLGNAYLHMKDRDKAIEVYKKAVGIDPGYAKGYFHLSLIYFCKNQYDLAIKYCDKAAELGFEIPPEFLEKLEQFRKK